ncbi:MAG: phosphoribosylanthranilate isomerase [Lentisphaerae bacterium]|nr:phosphoribosylanthranilate isomerase [Lentisphaerota bacterium]
MTLLVKICGLTRPSDVEAAIAAGADCLGFVLAPESPRCVSLAQLRALTAAVPPGIRRIGVVVNADRDLLAAAVEAGGLDAVQFHGDETAEALRAFTATTAWQAVALRTPADVDAAAGSPAAMIVADAAAPGRRGGTGTLCDWGLAEALARRRAVVLAGGLRPENVADAIAAVRPHGVDVSSGIESSPGCKDPTRLRDFIAIARAAAAAAGTASDSASRGSIDP